MRRRIKVREIRDALEEALEDTVDLTLRRIQLATVPHSKRVAETLRSTFVDRRGRTMSATIYSPYFWSRILNEGRDAAYKDGIGRFVWFRDPLVQDPRLDGDYHRTWAQARNAIKLRIPPEEFRERIRRGEIVVAKKLAPVPARNFLAEGTLYVKQDYKQFVQTRMEETLGYYLQGPSEYRVRVGI